MFAVTKRLLLRPGWAEDAPALTKAIAHARIARTTARMPWPYAEEDALKFLARERDANFPDFLIIDRSVDPVRIIGGIGFMKGEGAPELGYWITPDCWGQGFATEAGLAAIAAVQASLGYTRITAGHFADNPASGRVLTKLGFHPTGVTTPRYSRARGCDADCVMFEIGESNMRCPEEEALAA